MEQNAGPDTDLSTDATAAFQPSLSRNPLTDCLSSQTVSVSMVCNNQIEILQDFDISVLVGQALSQLGG